MRVVIADDEPLAIAKLQASLACIPEVTLVGAATGGAEAFKLLKELKPDLIILDIEMPGRDGFAVIEGLKGETEAPEVIFLTAHERYAVRAFAAAAVDYLTKPVAFERLRDAIQRAADRLAARGAKQRFSEVQKMISDLQDGRSADRIYEQTLWVRHNDGLELLPTETIDLIQASGDYVELIVGDKTHTIRDSISSLESRLDPALFARCHRSFIVNLRRIRGIRRKDRHRIVLSLATGRAIDVGPNYTDSVLEAVKAKRWR